MKKVPVLFIIFCREDITLQSFEAIKAYRPERLYIAADGPRTEKQGEAELCRQTRESVLRHIDWDCAVRTLFRDTNLGCTSAVSGALDWFFACEEYGIIIEDDCLLHSDFFTLCEQLLPVYRQEEKIMLISAQNHTPDLSHANRLVFSNRGFIWGWASWRRAWAKMDMHMTTWKQYPFGKLVKNFGFTVACFMFYYYRKSYRDIHYGSWDTRWNFSILANDGLSVSSAVNLSVNTGIEAGGANYEQGDTDPYRHIPFGSVEWEIQMPEKIEVTRKKIVAERKEFLRIRKIGMKKKFKKWLSR